MTVATMADVTDVLPIEETTAAKPPMVQQQRAIATTTPSDLLRIAVEGGADIDKLERLMELQQRWEANEARKAFVEAMAAFKREPITIYKRKGVGYDTKDGGFVGYKHAQLSDVTDAIAPAMAKHGLSFDWDIHQGNGSITVDCVVTHKAGHSKMVTMGGAPDNSGKKNAIQQAASTITYLQRYTLLAVTGMSTKDEDDDGAGGAEEGQQQRQEQTNNARTEKATPASSKPVYSAEKFELNKANWREIVKSGRKTPAQMVAFIETKGSALTEEMKLTIDSWSHEND